MQSEKDIPRILQLPKFLDNRGNLSFFENGPDFPFVIQRVHWIYDVPGGELRGGLAYKHTDEFILALSGSFVVEIDDGSGITRFPLNRSYYGLYVPRGLWRSIVDFSTNAVAVIAASTFYDPEDALRNYIDFIEWRKREKGV